ncbi:MAG: DUF3857 domain-containing protein, partial [Undibacterium sp.]|nr:DUF3857 domain-containing protein [Undibacterium sp.]
MSTAKTGATAFLRNVALPKWVIPLESVPATSSEEPVVVRLAEVQYWRGANPSYVVNRAVQVNSTSRLSEVGQYSIPFFPAYQKLVLNRLAILRDNQVLDRTKSANIRVLDSEVDANRGFYYGASTVQILMDDIKVGDTLWLVYTVEGNNPVFGGTWGEKLPWAKEHQVELRKVTVLHPSNMPVQWRFAGPHRKGIAQPLVETRNGITKIEFRESSLAAEEYEPSTPPNLIPFFLLDFSEYKDWTHVVKWASALFLVSSVHSEVKTLARKFEAGTQEERASKALHWTQDEIRYFSASMGENSHRPQLPEVVLSRGFGDCKDKSQLLVALYRAMGLEAQPVLVNSGAPELPAQFLPSALSFNHVIVRVMLNGKPYFVDPTLQFERGLISTLPTPLPSAAALVVANDSTNLITLPAEVIEQAQVERSEKMTIPTLNGEAQLHLRSEYRGHFATSLRGAARSLSTSEFKKSLLEQFERSYPGIQLEGAVSLSDANDGASFVVEANFSIPKVLKLENGQYFLPQRSRVIEGTLGIPDKLTRKHPFWMAAGHY